MTWWRSFARLALIRGALVLAVGACPVAASAQAPLEAPVDRFPDVLNQYRRMELLVPSGFIAHCDRKVNTLVCGVEGMPENFVRQLRALRGGVIDKVDIRGTRGNRFEVRLELRDAGLDFRSVMLAGPLRWVLEAGLPLTMSDPVEDETPFRPYPLAPASFEPILPKSPVVPPEGGGAPVEAVRGCVAAWKAEQLKQALKLCADAELAAAGDTKLLNMATMARAEVAAGLAQRGQAPDLTTATEALQAAERVAPTPESKARYVVLQARSYQPMGFPSRGGAHLDAKLAEYKGTTAMPWLLAGQLSCELEAGNNEAVTGIIKALQVTPGDNVNVGRATILAGGEAYVRRDWVRALELLDAAQRRWPAKLLESPEALFQFGELCAYFGRDDDARSLYAKYLELFPGRKPHHIARVRLADLTIGTDVLAARARLSDLALSLKEPEGQHLAALHAIRMTMDPKERRRTLQQVESSGPTDYVVPELKLELARTALANGRLREAYVNLRDIWRRLPAETLTLRAPKLFDRVLFLLMHNYVALDRPLAAISTYYAERPRFEAHSHREQMHLLAGRAFNRLRMSEEGYSVLQRGLRPVGPTGTQGRLAPESEAEIYLQMSDALHQMEDRFRLREILRYLDKKYPGHFDNFIYWRGRAADAYWAGDFKQARDIYVYALNGPVSEAERAELAGNIAEVYADMGDIPRAVRALETRVALHDASGALKESPVRRAAVWRLAEIPYEGEDWPTAVSGFGRFLEDYPDDPNRLEALFLKAKALQALGDTYSAVKLYDQLVTDPKAGEFGELAAMEMALLKWARREAPGLLKEAGFPLGR